MSTDFNKYPLKLFANKYLIVSDFVVRWFRGSKEASADLESGNFGSHLAASILRHGSFKSRRGDGIGRSLQRVRRRVERRLGRIGLGKGKKVVGGVEEATGSCKL